MAGALSSIQGVGQWGQGSYPRRGSDRPSQGPTISTVRAVGAGGEHLQPPSCDGKSLMGNKDRAG